MQSKLSGGHRTADSALYGIVPGRACGFRLAGRALAVGAIGILAANCSSQQKVAGRTVDSKYGVVASPRVVGENDPVPKGGGRTLVGRPYVIAGKTYVPQENPNYVREGVASWYGSAFHGRLTANGEIFDRYSVAAAHPTMPLPSYARVTNVQNNHSIVVRVNDRGPYHGRRIMDVSQRVAEALDFRHLGTARVRVEYLGKASTNGSDDRKLLATLRTDGRPAPFPGQAATMVAGAGPVAQPRQALAYRQSEPEPDMEMPEEAVSPALLPPARAQTLALATARPDPELRRPEARPAAPVPLPPERPFDLGTIPNAAVPVRAPSVGPTAHIVPKRQTAGLFYAPVVQPGRAAKDDPFRNLKPQRTIALKAE